jgi:hypothetical protein
LGWDEEECARQVEAYRVLVSRELTAAGLSV